MTHYGWFSEKMSKEHGYRLYAKSSLNESETKVNLITEKNEHGCNWDDVVFIGMIDINDFIRKEEKAYDPSHYFQVKFKPFPYFMPR